MTVRATHRRDDHGAAAIEFAFVAPILFALIFGLIYMLLVAAAHVSVAHAASVGARYAAIPTDPVTGIYPDVDTVEAKMASSSPFVRPDDCETVIDGEDGDNKPIKLSVNCQFPNPLGSTVNALIGRDDPAAGPFGDVMGLAATAEARRE